VRRKACLSLRLFIGLVLLSTAAGKLLDVPGFARVLATYDVLPNGLPLPLAAAVPLAELALAVWLFSGRRTPGAAWTAAIMHLVYAAWSAAALLRGLELANCGCFGVFLARPLGWRTVAEDLVMTGLSVALLSLSRR
jgi:uncharacterized membrane protein YphA (DoxX/SURF4 family)